MYDIVLLTKNSDFMSFSELIGKNLRFVIILPILVAGLVFVLSLFKQPLYKSSVSLLVVQKQTDEVNAEAAVKSAEQMADILARVVDSQTFRSAVMTTGNVNVSLPTEPWEEAKKWNEYVKTKNITDTGILIVDVYQPTSSQATRLAAAVANVLTTQAYDYLGVTAESVSIRHLNPPSPTSDQPATPNLLLNAAVGWLAGLILALCLMLLFPEILWSRYFSFSHERIRYVLGGHNAHHYEFNRQSGGLIYSDKLTQAVASAGDYPNVGESYERPEPARDIGPVQRANTIINNKRS